MSQILARSLCLETAGEIILEVTWLGALRLEQSDCYSEMNYWRRARLSPVSWSSGYQGQVCRCVCSRGTGAGANQRVHLAQCQQLPGSNVMSKHNLSLLQTTKNKSQWSHFQAGADLSAAVCCMYATQTHFHAVKKLTCCDRQDSMQIAEIFEVRILPIYNINLLSLPCSDAKSIFTFKKHMTAFFFRK